MCTCMLCVCIYMMHLHVVNTRVCIHMCVSVHTRVCIQEICYEELAQV